MTGHARRFPLFDGLRAVAALSVVLYHAVYQSDVLYTAGPLRAWTAHLDAGVSVFFAISGFLLYRPFVAARLAGEDAPSIAAYGWRRVLRIVPAYWVALVVVVAVLDVGGVFTASGIPTYFGFLQVYDPDTVLGGIGQAWTLCVEVAFYAFLPLYALVLRRGARGAGVRAEWLGVAVLAGAGLAWNVVALRRVDAADPHALAWLLAPPAHLDQFAIGMGLAVLSASGVRVRGAALWGPALALAAFALVSVGIGLDGSVTDRVGDGQWLARHVLYGLVALGLLAPATFAEEGGVRRVLGTPAVLWVGLVSYGVYLWHVAVFTQLGRWGLTPGDSRIGWLLAGLGLSLLVAAASYYLVERPAMRLRRLVRPAGEPGDQPGAAGVPATPEGVR